jgi:hypothetical protein
MRVVLTGLLLISSAGNVDAAPIELFSASINPTQEECAAIAEHNSKQQREILEQHHNCLAVAPSDRSNFEQSSPCSKLACREIHLKMEWISEQNRAINNDCRARIADRTKSENDLKKTNLDSQVQDLFENAKKGYDIQKKMDTPWEIAEMAWGNLAGRVRSQLAAKVSNGATKRSSDWDLYELIFNKSYEQNIKLRQSNPVARMVTEGMLSKLFVTHAELYGTFMQAMKNMEDIGASLPNSIDKQRIRPVYFPRSPANETQGNRNKTSLDCDIFLDMEKSSALLTSSPSEWDTLNKRCNNK